jgi:cystathionine beta-lyase
MEDSTADSSALPLQLEDSARKKPRINDYCIDTVIASQLNMKDPHGAVSMPIYQTATFEQPGASEFGKYDYTRSGNPTRDAFQDQMALLEGVQNAKSFAFSSGMSAISAMCRLVSCGEEIIANDDSYGGTYRLLSEIVSRQGIVVKYVDMSGADGRKRLQEAVTSKTRLVLVETPTNPMQRICDIRALAAVCQGSAHPVGTLLAVDNTMLSPVLCRPLELGADIVVHSATKYICGHSDTMAGVVTVRPVVQSSGKTLSEEVYFVQNAEGTGLAPFDCWLVLRGMKTMALRVYQQQKNAQKIAQWLVTQPSVTSVLYAGLPTHADYNIHTSQAAGAGAVVCFLTDNVALSEHITTVTRLFKITVSFGSVCSLISLPGRMSHASIPEAVRTARSFPESLVRLCIGTYQK